MTPWATFSDLKTRYPSVTDDMESRATALLSDATALIDSELDATGISYSDPGDVFKANLVSTCCAMVIRALPSNASVGYTPITQTSQTAGPFSESMTFANPSGDLYLTKAEREKIGLSGGGAMMFYVDMTPTSDGDF